MDNNKQNDAGQQAADPEVSELQKALQTPISREDAEKAFADIDVKRMQLMVVRQKWQARLSQMTLQIQALDEQLTALDLDRAVVFRRTLVKPEGGADA